MNIRVRGDRRESEGELGFAREIVSFCFVFFRIPFFSRLLIRFPVMALQGQETATESTRKDEDSTDDFEETAFFRRGCCWSFPCNISQKSDNWERISTSEREEMDSGSRSWWSKGIKALKKVREWSELVAGPKWKTFIRRFNKTPARHKTGKFQYDPFSYALNFDEGPGQIGQFEDDRVFRDFSSRYAAIPIQNSQLKDLN